MGAGRAREKIYVNSATGNLIVQDQDKRLSALGLDLAIVGIYNLPGGRKYMSVFDDIEIVTHDPGASAKTKPSSRHRE